MAAASGVSEIDARLEQWYCNICLDPACDPVTTFCGHLYCWPCIYQVRMRACRSIGGVAVVSAHAPYATQLMLIPSSTLLLSLIFLVRRSG